MPAFGRISRENLAEAHPELQRLFNEVIKTTDCMVICGHRGQAAQDSCFHSGVSKLPWPRSKHNTKPAKAVDVIPYPVNWMDIARFDGFAQTVKEVAKTIGVEVVWGGDWPKFRDRPHWEVA